MYTCVYEPEDEQETVPMQNDVNFAERANLARVNAGLLTNEENEHASPAVCRKQTTQPVVITIDEDSHEEVCIPVTVKDEEDLVGPPPVETASPPTCPAMVDTPGKRVRKPPILFFPQHHGKSHKFKRIQNKEQGELFAQYKNSRASVGGMGNGSLEEYDMYTNAGYNTRRGYINLEFDSATPPQWK